jgi:GMP synthase - Glutamine amidotransferase domain
MRLNVLQHTPNEGPGAITEWANQNNYSMYVYHPYFFNGVLPTIDETDMLVILGGPMSPNDDLTWIKQERTLIKEAIDKDIPIFGVCYGAQQIVKTLGGAISKSPSKEVGWDEVKLESNDISTLPNKLNVLHWHEEMFEIPQDGQLLFSGKHLTNQGFILGNSIVGLQFHLEPLANNVREIVTNDKSYINGSVLKQTASEIINTPVPNANKKAIFEILNHITKAH